MAIKIENLSHAKLPRRTEAQIEKILETIPREHTRGIDRLRLVETINDPRLKIVQKTALPGLYHPRQGTQQAWLEISTDALLPRAKPLHKRLLPRLSFKGNLAAIIFSLVGQHYYLTLRHSVKKGQLESSVRAYTERHLRLWSEREHTLRARLFKPFQPTLERWARSLQRRAATEQKKRPG
ncbi:MAG TPA: hypothetical protein VNA19_10690 [Pyrinomonadaceae bacterium]|jgi:hypothetical protein|nr:hypothetical protein [Pyrinomonadaceae bacterium]